MSQNASGTFDEPDSMSDQKCSETTSPDSSDAAVTETPQSQSCVSSASENNVSCSSNSSSDNANPNSTSNKTPSPSVLTTQNCSVLRKSFLNQVSDSASTSENVVSTTPKFQLKSSSFGNSLLLKPSALSASKPGSSSGGFALKAATLKNPFAKNASLPEVSNSTQDGAGSENMEEVTSSEQVSPLSGASAPSEPNAAPSSSTSLSSGLVSPPKFVPLLSNTSSTSGNSSSTSAGGFVFGQNLRDRVEAVEEEQATASEASSTANTSSATSTANTFASTNGTTDMLFTSVLQKETADKVDSGGEDNGTTPPKSLSEAAREYEEARANKRKYDEVAVVTGEEEEANVLQINCKLFLYDSVKTWIELGRGQLRLNDISNSLSRIVIRVAGSLRVILNTKIWAGMVVQKASDNSVRLTAKENGQAKVYLVKASSKEIDQLFKALEWRVNNQKKLGIENGNGSSSSHEDDVVESKKHITENLVVTNGTSGLIEDKADSATQPLEHST